MADESDERWTVRGVGKAARESASDAAQRRKVTVGAWLTGAIDREINAEREPFDLAVPADKSSDTADTLADARLALIERAVAAAVSLAGAPDVPRAFRQRANRLLREGLPPPRPRVERDRGERRLRADAAHAGLLNGAGAVKDQGLDAGE